MNKDSITPYKIDAEKEKKLWEKLIFVFDSSALLDFYFLPKKTREKVYREVFSKLAERLWMPSHVEYEFIKNREGAILNPIKEKYAPLREKIFNLNKELSIKVIKRIDEISRETLKEDKHPFIDQSEIEKIRSSFKNFDKDLKAFEK